MATNPAEPVAPPPYQLAGLWRRLAAVMYELLLLAALAFIVEFALLPLATPGHAGNVDTLVIPALPAQVILFCCQFAAGALYFGWFWTRGRRTLPQKTWRLRIVTVAGGTLDRKRALLRYFACWLSPLAAIAVYALLQPTGWGKWAALVVVGNFLWAFIDRERLFLHDRVAGTRVVRSDEGVAPIAPHPRSVSKPARDQPTAIH